MLFSSVLAATASFALVGVANAAHGDGDEGTIMGPVAFLWPENREWDSVDDNIGPCGSSEGVTNRTEFPLSQGSVALSIADEAYKVAFYVAFTNDPTRQSEFQEQIVNNVTEIVPGHQCYNIDDIPSSIAAGTNATIQLQYWAVYEGENNNQNETFYACADITFVEDSDFTGQIPCFNVTASTFDDGDSSTTTTATGSAATTTGSDGSTTTGAASSSETTSSSSSSTSKSSSGLSAGAKAGIAIGSIVGALAIGGLAVFIYLRKRRTGYLDRRRASKINAPIPLYKRNPDGTSLTSN